MTFINAKSWEEMDTMIETEASKKNGAAEPTQADFFIEPAAPAAPVTETLEESLEPFWDYLLCEYAEEAAVSAGGIHLPGLGEDANSKYAIGVIVDMGNMVCDFTENNTVPPLMVDLGDRILVNKYGVTEVELNRKKFFMIRKVNVVGLLK